MTVWQKYLFAPSLARSVNTITGVIDAQLIVAGLGLQLGKPLQILLKCVRHSPTFQFGHMSHSTQVWPSLGPTTPCLLDDQQRANNGCGHAFGPDRVAHMHKFTQLGSALSAMAVNNNCQNMHASVDDDKNLLKQPAPTSLRAVLK